MLVIPYLLHWKHSLIGDGSSEIGIKKGFSTNCLGVKACWKGLDIMLTSGFATDVLYLVLVSCIFQNFIHLWCVRNLVVFCCLFD